MKRKIKGRKIYKTKEKNYYGKSVADRILSACLTLLLIGGIGIVGYSAAGPILNFTRRRGDDTQLPYSVDDSDFQGATESTEGEEASSPEKPTGQAVVQEASAEQYRAAAVKAADLSTLESLRNALARIPAGQDIEYVEIPLKSSEGNVYYNSTSEPGWRSGAVRSTIMLQDIVETVREAGYRPAAVISTFSDNVLPTAYPETGYALADSYDQWIDDSIDAGGKPWLSPYSQEALSYLTYLTDEAVAAGFECIVCSDFVFPPFRDSDLAILDERLGRKDRYLAMTSAANLLYDRILSGGSRMLLEVSAAEVLRGNDDILQPMFLSAGTVVVNIDLDQLEGGVYDGKTMYEFTGTAADKTSKMLGFIKERFTDFNTVIRISGTGLSAEELVKASGKINEYGFSSFVIG